MDIGNIISNITGTVLTIIGTALTVYYGRKSILIQKEIRNYDWHDIQIAVHNIYRRMKKDFEPDIIFATCLRGAIVSEIFLYESKLKIPVIVGVAVDNQNSKVNPEFDDHVKAKTITWTHLIPELIFKFKDRRVLLVDDFCVLGESFEIDSSILIAGGFAKENIKTMSVATTNAALLRTTPPNYYYYVKQDDDFYFPWGKANS